MDLPRVRRLHHLDYCQYFARLIVNRVIDKKKTCFAPSHRRRIPVGANRLGMGNASVPEKMKVLAATTLAFPRHSFRLTAACRARCLPSSRAGGARQRHTLAAQALQEL
jgi:hypothetical protein